MPTIDFALEAAFPKLDDGEQPRIEKVREQIRSYADGYCLARKKLPDRIVLAPEDFAHVLGRVATRLNRERKRTARAEFEDRRAKGEKARWKDMKPAALTVDGLSWGGAADRRGAALLQAPPGRHEHPLTATTPISEA